MAERNNSNVEGTTSGAKRLWVEPTMDVIASVSDVAGKVGIDLDEDFTGIPLPS